MTQSIERKYPSWGNFLKNQRLKKYRSAREFCSRQPVGISYPQYSRYEAGDQLPNLDQAMKLCRFLEIPTLEGLLEWNRAQVSEPEALDETNRYLEDFRSNRLQEALEAKNPVEPQASGFPLRLSQLNEVMVFNRSHLKLFKADPAFRDFFTYVVSCHPLSVHVETISKALGLEPNRVEQMGEDLVDMGVLVKDSAGAYLSVKKGYYFPDDQDFFELRNDNLRYNSNAILESVTPEALNDRKAYRGLVTRELDEQQLEQVISTIEGMVRKMATLPESPKAEKVFSLCILLGERFSRGGQPVQGAILNPLFQTGQRDLSAEQNQSLS